MKRILTSDLLIADIITSVDGNPELQSLLESYGHEPKSKNPLSRTQFDKFAQAVTGHDIKIMPGGSSANTLVTLGKLLNHGDVSTTFIGITGEGMYSGIVKNALSQSGIELVPSTLPHGGPTPETAVSYVSVFPDGERTIATYPGNAKEILKPEMVTESMVKDCDAVFVQGSLWQKLDWAFADKLLELRAKHGKELWLALPTHAEFGADKKDHFEWLLPSANLVMANLGELARTTGVIGKGVKEDDITPEQKQQALEKLQEIFRKGFHGKDDLMNGKNHVGFITMGKEGAAVVTPDNIEFVKAAPDPVGKKYTLGGGDTSYAGFLAGYIKGMPPRACAEIAMALAGEKLKVNAPRLDHPQTALREAAPNLANALLGPKGAHHSQSTRTL